MLFEVLFELMEDSTKSKVAGERVMQIKSSTYLARNMMSADSCGGCCTKILWLISSPRSSWSSWSSSL